MANPHAVLSLLDAPEVCDPALYIIWCRFRQLRRHLSYRPGEVAWVYSLLDLAAAGRPGHGPLHLLLQSANDLGFAWDSGVEGWIRPGLPPLRMLAGPYQHFKSAIIEAWRNKVSRLLALRKGFQGGNLLDFSRSMQLLFSSHLRERDKMLLRSIFSGRVWNGFLLGKSKKEDVPCQFCGGADGDGHLFWECSFPPFCHIREHPEFSSLMRLDRVGWPRCLAWHGWLPALSPRRIGVPWATALADTVDASLETALGGYPLSLGSNWNPGWDPEDIVDLADDFPATPNMWTDGSRDEDLDALVRVAGAGAFTASVPWVFDGRAWGHAQDLDVAEDACRIFSMVPGWLQTVQRAEYWGVILALQALMPLHLGVDNLNVCNKVDNLLRRWSGLPFPLCTDGDLLDCISSMIWYGGRASVKVSKVKGHATEAMILDGQVRREDKGGNDAADIAADFGRLRQPEVVIDARQNLLRERKDWYPRMLLLHRFMDAISREALNRSSGDGDSIDPMIWDCSSRPKARKLENRVIREFAGLPGPVGFLNSSWVRIDSGPVTASDIAA